jgi:hypothetical protein
LKASEWAGNTSAGYTAVVGYNGGCIGVWRKGIVDPPARPRTSHLEYTNTLCVSDEWRHLVDVLCYCFFKHSYRTHLHPIASASPWPKCIHVNISASVL